MCEQHEYHVVWEAIPDRTGVSEIPIKLVAGEHMQIARIDLPVGSAQPSE